MKMIAKNVALALLKCGFGLLRFSLFILLLLVGRVLLPVANLATGVGLMLFLFCAVFLRDQVTPMWAGAGLAVCGVVLVVFYHSLLQLVAPDDVVIFTEL